MLTLFEKIASREIPAQIVFEDEHVIAFHDARPQAPVHVLLVPKRLITRVGEARPGDEQLLGHLLVVSGEVAKQLGVLKTGYRLVVNHGADAGETVPHLHVHLLAGRPLGWPPG